MAGCPERKLTSELGRVYFLISLKTKAFGYDFKFVGKDFRRIFQYVRKMIISLNIECVSTGRIEEAKIILVPHRKVV